MKGLLIKDIRLIANQKRFVFLYLAVALVLSVSMDSSFIVSYVPMVAMLLVLSTISYDFNDNGLSFIMTLPGKPGDYAVEKYIFTAAGVTFMWMVSLVLQFASFAIQKRDYVLNEVILTDAMMLPMFLLIVAIMIPIELKYSPEKGRTALFVIFGIVMIVAIAGKSIIEKLGGAGDAMKLVAKLQTASPAVIIIAAYAVCLIAFSISMICSIRIMQNKEF
ncbi:MAG: ABC-2 transporter permease [Lachnospiraceae bacterium]|nr:ABC-2 transporter permease [Lachnospiraceae bacterium]MBP1586355.1 ABC-2 transporter permease [Lachnospiraceae bacterium]